MQLVCIGTSENLLKKALPRAKFDCRLEALGVVEPTIVFQVGRSVGVSKSG